MSSLANQVEILEVFGQQGYLPVEWVEAILEEEKMGLEALMIGLLPIAQKYAVVPVSDYRVGAVAAGRKVSEKGARALYLGANFEISGVALSFTVHAEQAALNQAWLNGEGGLHAMAISAAPCGYCRQFLYELGGGRDLAILIAQPKEGPVKYTAITLGELLPQAFGPADLGVAGGLMQGCAVPGLFGGQLSEDPLIALAVQAAMASYAPYLKPPLNAGVGLQLRDGSIYPGRYAENAAYNPSLSPLESALVFMHLSRPLGMDREVTRCVLAETLSGVSQRSATEAVLAAVAPKVQLEYFKVSLPVEEVRRREVL